MSEPATQQPLNDASDLPVGEILRRTRVHYSRSIEDVEAALRIQAKQIHAIEIGDNEALPARVYAIGFVRSYAEYLGLDGDKIVELFKSQSNEPSPAQSPSRKTPATQSKNPPVGIVVGLLVLVCAIMLAVLSMGGSNPDETESTNATNAPKTKVVKKDAGSEIPEVPEELTVAALEKKQAIKPPEPEPTPEPVAEKPKGIVLKMVQNSWVEIRDQNNRKLISRVLNAGDQYFVPDRLGLSISIGNAGGVEILVDGRVLEGLGKKGQVLRRIPLNADALKSRFPFKEQKPVESNGENE